MPELVLPTTSVHESFLEAMDEFVAEGAENSQTAAWIDHNAPGWQDPEVFEAFCEAVRADAREETPRPRAHVPCTTLWWVDGGHYAAVLGGQYHRRSDPAPMYDDVSASVQSYRDAFSESEDPLFKALKDFGNSVSEGSRAIVDQVRDLFGGRKIDKSDKNDKDEG